MEGNSVRGIEQSELVVAFSGANGKGSGIARANSPAVLDIIIRAQVEEREEEADEVRMDMRERCQGELPANVTVFKEVSPGRIERDVDSASQAIPVTYTLHVANTGGTPIDAITIVDALPQGFHVESVDAKDYARSVGESIMLPLTFWMVFPLVKFISKNSSKTEFSTMAYEVVSASGRDHLVVKLEMKEEPLTCTGNQHYVILDVNGTYMLSAQGAE